MGIEPTYSDWQPDVLPLYYTRFFMPGRRVELRPDLFQRSVHTAYTTPAYTYCT